MTGKIIVFICYSKWFKTISESELTASIQRMCYGLVDVGEGEAWQLSLTTVEQRRDS